MFLILAVVGSRWQANLVVEPKDQFLLGTIGALFVAMAVLGPAFRSSYTATAVILLNSLFLAFAVELVVAIADRLDEDPPEEIVRNEVLAALPLEQRHGVEFGESDRKRLEPYVLWKLAPYSGQTIKIGDTGVRDTPGTHCIQGAYKVFTFGGSAMWGAGAADSETIPAFLRARLEEAGRPVCVTNYAQNGYVVGQVAAELMNLLLDGERPDLVISYDGYNDVYVAYEQGFANRQFQYEDLKHVFQPVQSHWYQMLAVYWRVHPPPPETYEWHDYTTMGKDAEALSTEVANRYFNSYGVIEALAAKWHFEFALFIQPNISMSKKPLTKAEQPILVDASEPLKRLTSGIYGRLEKGAKERKRLFYIADVFDHAEGDIWLDPVHVPGEGNKIVAERIASILSKEGIYPGARAEAR